MRIRGDQLQPRDGRYELRVTNELEEALFVDRLQLVAVAHPAGVEVYPERRAAVAAAAAVRADARRAARVRRVARGRRARPRRAAALIARSIAAIRTTSRLLPIRGYAERSTALTLDLGARGRRARVLLLTGWTDYAFSSDNVAASPARARR